MAQENRHNKERFALILTRDKTMVERVQALRYRVFFEEMGARDPLAEKTHRDCDVHDAFCDHLVVLDTHEEGRVVAVCRLLRREDAERTGGFYSRHEFDLSAVLAYNGSVAELGRFCIDERYRHIIYIPRLIWCGLAEYIQHYKIDVLFGSAIFSGEDPQEHADALLWLWHNYLAPPELRLVAINEGRIDAQSFTKNGHNRRVDKEAQESTSKTLMIPPLMKAYMRFGCYVSDGATWEKEFNSVSIGIVVCTKGITKRYLMKERQLFC